VKPVALHTAPLLSSCLIRYQKRMTAANKTALTMRQVLACSVLLLGPVALAPTILTFCYCW
jgi:hypothetical protein